MRTQLPFLLLLLSFAPREPYTRKQIVRWAGERVGETTKNLIKYSVQNETFKWMHSHHFLLLLLAYVILSIQKRITCLAFGFCCSDPIPFLYFKNEALFLLLSRFLVRRTIVWRFFFVNWNTIKLQIPSQTHNYRARERKKNIVYSSFVSHLKFIPICRLRANIRLTHSMHGWKSAWSQRGSSGIDCVLFLTVIVAKAHYILFKSPYCEYIQSKNLPRQTLHSFLRRELLIGTLYGLCSLAMAHEIRYLR